MAITPADIEQMTFSEDKKHGYNTEEVDAFLDQLSAEVDAMLQKIADLKGRLNNSEQQLAAAQAQVAQLKEQSAATPVEVAPAPAPAADFSASERQISQVLIVAQQSADKLVADARTNAENIRNEADQKAREVIRQALAEKQNELDEIDRLKQSREDFRAEYKRLLQHFMDDADSVFPEKVLTAPNGSAAAHTESYAAPAVQPASAVAETDAAPYAPVSSTAPADFSDLD
ncbi:DivIVA domain protein [Olsenella uli DSM 7084]|uniref:Cell wall synthesis protein Wag31 n=1 Tax=Olsenella uli (strain ATCC 49627 / DSM 7084 / CCUG 31166 / CIP 109912 / JCM 12494 / LMG 11480 / NCIMB 702895 / VPI D76D-27C) TaxID=633147 RepID=E1QVP5_OLSUV|nr:DivIVA domain-containing protein [Olsenella uli]ADK68198.1 DivIVA domain protein [Olsenella uli DSM 7084]EUB32794.1 DivIVA protein [Olsenella uli MSTE5]